MSYPSGPPSADKGGVASVVTQVPWILLVAARYNEHLGALITSIPQPKSNPAMLTPKYWTPPARFAGVGFACGRAETPPARVAIKAVVDFMLMVRCSVRQ